MIANEAWRSLPASRRSAVERELARAALLRFSALLFHPPDRMVQSHLRELSATLPSELRDAAAALAARLADADAETDYHRLLGGSGAVPDCESDYAVAGLGSKGPLLADVAGFYAAFAYGGPSSVPLQPDHISAELDFLAYLSLKSAYARCAGLSAERAACQSAADEFIHDHAGRFCEAFFARLSETAGPCALGDAARFAASAIPTLR